MDMNDFFAMGFCKAAEEHGVDPVQLAKFAAYKPMYATSHNIGTFRENVNAVKNWFNGGSPAMNASFATIVDKDNLAHDMSSISAPTLVDRVHNWWNSATGGTDLYGTEDRGKPITPQQFDATVQGYRSRTPGIRAPNPGEYDGSWTQNDDGSFSRGNTRSYPIDPNTLFKQIPNQEA